MDRIDETVKVFVEHSTRGYIELIRYSIERLQVCFSFIGFINLNNLITKYEFDGSLTQGFD